jgi:hypothetical protein
MTFKTADFLVQAAGFFSVRKRHYHFVEAFRELLGPSRAPQSQIIGPKISERY